MNEHLQSVFNIIQRDENLPGAEKNSIIKSLEDADKALDIATFKRGKTEKDGQEVTGLLEKASEELEQARRTVKAQNRELEIEASLERVRARTMAMQQSNELAETVSILFKQLLGLGIRSTQMRTCAIVTLKPNEPIGECWITTPNGDIIPQSFIVPYDETSAYQTIYAAWKNGEKFLVVYLSGEALLQHLAFLKKYAKIPTQQFQSLPDQPAETYTHALFFSQGYLFIISNEPLPEYYELFKRFGAVFQQTYTRFLDLQKAEAQSREAQIELSLERVRAKTMAMHNSQDVGDTVATMFDELVKLGVETIRCGIGIMHDTKEMEVWTAKPDEKGKVDLIIGRLNMMMHPLLKGAYEGWENKQEFYTYELMGDDLIDYFNAINDHPDYPIKYDIASLPKRIVHSEFHFSEGTLFVFSLEKLSEATSKIFKRFAGVFGQTYRRYLDLKKAEAQATEAKIEAALERVRAKAMAMHSSEDLADTIRAFYHELELMSVTPRRCGVGLIDKETHIAEISSMNTTEEGESLAVIGNLDLSLHPVLRGIYDNWLLQKDYRPVIRGSGIKEYYQIITPHISFPDYPNDFVQYGYFFFFAEGGVYAWTEKEMTEEELKIYRRFTSVLTLTYKRYKDLKHAEEQAREATIEAALERVRGKAMAMHNSNDLSSAASMVFTELKKLGINPIRSGVGLISKESHKVTLYGSAGSEHGDSLTLVGWAILEGHPVLVHQYDCWLKKEDYFPVLKGELLKTYYEKLSANFSVPLQQSDNEQYGHFLMFTEGFLFCWSEKAYPEAEVSILDRFKKILELTFKRYFDLQKSESNARDAIKQASLDRVRAEIASMRTTADLERITPLIWNELTILGISFIRCGVFIMDEQQEQVHTFLSTPDGKSIAAFHLPYSAPGEITGQVLANWRKKEMYKAHWDEAAFMNWTKSLVEQGAIASEEKYLTEHRPTNLDLHFLPFLQGMLYVGNESPLSDEEIQVVQTLADAFSTAYARYEDFNKLESAKVQIEKTLVHLKEAQAQLVQSEKMASLGELTAGIAHEIQNPLNFVNNFSEVSNELITEMTDELNKGSISEAKIIANDIRQNLEKINHHGRRADAIVKGMLQHSRKSSSQKEPTAINALADEYLRLAYHGIRAKDNSFNATLKTGFDETIGNINIIPQDIGRVLLNLYNNAFYAVKPPAPKGGPENLQNKYTPTVSVSTKKIGDKVEIKVADNGNGIPQRILDKIFQPFFTTKPTGQGTGLGLSLAYDIIKAHGGEIKIETKEGVGTEFSIQLPIL